MYDELYEIWRRELQNAELERLPPDFGSKVADYLRRLKEENRMLDKRTVKAKLLKTEAQNTKRMLHELFWVRYKKMIKKATEGDKVPNDTLTKEEGEFLTAFSSQAEAYQAFIKNLSYGHSLQMNIERRNQSAVLRFLKDIPEIIGADMKPYGPFRVEDIASLPYENAQALIKQGLAEKIEII